MQNEPESGSVDIQDRASVMQAIRPIHDVFFKKIFEKLAARDAADHQCFVPCFSGGTDGDST